MHRGSVQWAIGNLVNRFNRVGIQTRIMLYVTVGLAAMFGGFASLGFRAVGDATQLVYEERLTTAYTTAGIIERDFTHLARDADEVFTGVDVRSEAQLIRATGRLLSHLAVTDPFPFFRITGVWAVMDPTGVVAAAGGPGIGSKEQIATVLSALVAFNSYVLASITRSVFPLSVTSACWAEAQNVEMPW